MRNARTDTAVSLITEYVCGGLVPEQTTKNQDTGESYLQHATFPIDLLVIMNKI